MSLAPPSAAPARLEDVVERVLRNPDPSEVDWGSVMYICERCVRADVTLDVVKQLVSRMKAANADDSLETSMPSQALLLNSLNLLDSLVKNCPHARSHVAASKDLRKLVESVARLDRKVKRASSSGRKDASLIDREDDSPVEEKAMRIFQAWGALHPDAFPEYLKRYEELRKAGVVFPAAAQEDLVPIASDRKNGSSRPVPPQTATKTTAATTQRGGAVSLESEMQQARETATLLKEMATGGGDAAESRDIVDSLVANCKELHRKVGMYIQEAVERQSAPGNAGGQAQEERLARLFALQEELDESLRFAHASPTSPAPPPPPAVAAPAVATVPAYAMPVAMPMVPGAYPQVPYATYPAMLVPQVVTMAAAAPQPQLSNSFVVQTTTPLQPVTAPVPQASNPFAAPAVPQSTNPYMIDLFGPGAPDLPKPYTGPDPPPPYPGMVRAAPAPAPVVGSTTTNTTSSTSANPSGATGNALDLLL